MISPPPGLEMIKPKISYDDVADLELPPGLTPQLRIEPPGNLHSKAYLLDGSSICEQQHWSTKLDHEQLGAESVYTLQMQALHMQALRMQALQMQALQMQALQMQALQIQAFPAWDIYAQSEPPSPLLDGKLVEYPISHCSTVASLGGGSCSESEDVETGVGNHDVSRQQARQIKVDKLEMENGGARVVVDWPVGASKFTGNDRQIVSPSFEIHPGITCRLMIQPSFVGERKGQGGFKKAKGKGSIQLKCEAKTSINLPQVSFSLTIGTNGSWQPPRGPVNLSFSNSSVCSLPRDDEWDFRSAVGKTSKICDVRLEIVHS